MERSCDRTMLCSTETWEEIFDQEADHGSETAEPLPPTESPNPFMEADCLTELACKLLPSRLTCAVPLSV